MLPWIWHFLKPTPYDTVAMTPWLWRFLVNLHVYSSPFYLAAAQSQYLMVIGRGGGLSTLCHSCRFAWQQSALKTFPGPSCFHSEDGMVWLLLFLINFHVDIYTYLPSEHCYVILIPLYCKFTVISWLNDCEDMKLVVPTHVVLFH